MRMSRLFSRTLRESPSEADATSHQLLMRAGFIRSLASGIYTYLPLAHRALAKIEAIIREEMEAIGGQEITMPVVHPASLWQETGRWYQIGSEMGRFTDRQDRDMVLAMTHEEVVADLVRQEIRSYDQLPQLVYQIQTKWRDDPRPRAGLIRVREFTMKDSYSLDADWEGLDRQYRAHYQAYFNIFRRCGLEVLAVTSDTGMMGGALAHEFMVLTPIGEDTLMLCDACSYAANRQIARFEKPEALKEELRPVEKVATPGVTTIDDLAEFLDIPPSRTAKAVFRMATMVEGQEEVERFVFAVVRGDMGVNATKLANLVKARDLRPATEGEIRAVGAEPGYGSPLGVEGAIVVVDDAVAASPNLVAGANESGFHLLNVNYGRDYEADLVGDIAAAEEGDACMECGAPLRAARGVEVGNIFKLGTRYTEALGATFDDAEGKAHPVIMGSYGIGVGRTLACIAETRNDEYGLIWPISVAPYQVHLTSLARERGDEVDLVAEGLYADMHAAGIEVLYDDREESAGVKFYDADLIGLPLRITVGSRGLKKGGVELKHRDAKERSLVALETVVTRVQTEIKTLEATLTERVVEEDFTV
ncbi:MAG: proline--tRNA ligase [Anaerolineae bacterium]